MRVSLKIQGADGLKKLAAKIKQYPAHAAQAGIGAANDAAETIMTRAPQDITNRYNLPASYIKARFTLRKAKAMGDEAIIGARKRGTGLERFAAQQETVAAPRAKGDPRRGIAAGRKQAGASAQVLRQGGRKTTGKAFFMPLKRGGEAGGSGMGLCIRNGEKFDRLYSGSPHHSYRYCTKQNNPAISNLLAKAFAARIAQQLRKGSK